MSDSMWVASSWVSHPRPMRRRNDPRRGLHTGASPTPKAAYRRLISLGATDFEKVADVGGEHQDRRRA